MRQGWRPDRTIVLAGWDGEEYGLLGSTEWAEQYERDLHAKAVAYLNVDITAGQEFGAGAAPALDKLLFDVTKTVPEPGTATSVYDKWRGDSRRPTIDRLGSGSDYTGPFDHVGVPSLEAGYTSPSGEYHSAYDDTYQLEHFLDPGYVHEAAAAKVLGVTALRLANADVYPLRYSDYATAVQGYVDDLAAGRAAAGRRAGRPVVAASGRAGLGRGGERPRGARGPAAGARATPRPQRPRAGRASTPR